MISGSIPYGAKECMKNSKSRKGFLDEFRVTRNLIVGDTPISWGFLDLDLLPCPEWLSRNGGDGVDAGMDRSGHTDRE